MGDNGKWDEVERCLKAAFGENFDTALARLAKIGYTNAPASKSHHLAMQGGLMLHSYNVAIRLMQVTDAMGVKWPRAESPYVVGMLHDLVKCRCYREIEGTPPGEPPKWEYVQPGYPGHGSCSVAIAAELGFTLMAEEIAAITYHMGPWGVGKEYSEEEFRAAMEKWAPQIIAAHSADWYASQVDERMA